MERELDKMKEKYNKEVKNIEKENETLKKQISESGGNMKLNH
jgi:hypothetical protein